SNSATDRPPGSSPSAAPLPGPVSAVAGGGSGRAVAGSGTRTVPAASAAVHTRRSSLPDTSSPPIRGGFSAPHREHQTVLRGPRAGCARFGATGSPVRVVRLARRRGVRTGGRPGPRPPRAARRPVRIGVVHVLPPPGQTRPSAVRAGRPPVDQDGLRAAVRRGDGDAVRLGRVPGHAQQHGQDTAVHGPALEGGVLALHGTSV